MKDEEMAEEYKESKRHKCFRADVGKIQIDYETYLNNLKDGFLAGLKAGRPQWHDLRKDPNDLPKDYGSVWTNKGGACHDNDGWYDDCGYVNGVVAWCEPQFKE